MKLTHSTLAASLLLTGVASAQVVASDNFSYVGPLTSNGWTAHSAGGNKVIMSNGSFATLDQSAGSGEDINLAFAPFGAADTVYASFTLNMPSGNPVNPDNQGLYFAHFKDLTTLFRARTGVLSPAAGGDFQLAINADNADLGLGAAWPIDLVFDTNYTVVISWNAATGESKLWVNPYAESSPSVSHTGTFTGTIIEQFALRQSNDYTGLNYIDDVVVGRTFADVVCASQGSISVLDTPDCAAATFAVTGSPFAGNTVTATVSGATGVPLVIAGASSVNVPLLGLFGCDCVLVPSFDALIVGASLPIALPPALPPGAILFLQGGDLTFASSVASPCDVTGLFLGLTDAACIVTG